MKTWIDISQRLHNNMVVWPGDTPFSYKLTWSKKDGCSANVGEITMSTHSGTHIDAPFHFDNAGKKIIELDLELYIGRARIIHLPNITSIGLKEISDFDLKGVTRLLIRTDAWKDRNLFPASIPPIEPTLAPYLADCGVRLLGLDLPSVDPLDSEELLAHHTLTSYGIHILEGLVLEEVLPGDYELTALPLALADADGSPVRAVLKKIL